MATDKISVQKTSVSGSGNRPRAKMGHDVVSKKGTHELALGESRDEPVVTRKELWSYYCECTVYSSYRDTDFCCQCIIVVTM